MPPAYFNSQWENHENITKKDSARELLENTYNMKKNQLPTFFRIVALYKKNNKTKKKSGTCFGTAYSIPLQGAR